MSKYVDCHPIITQYNPPKRRPAFLRLTMKSPRPEYLSVFDLLCLVDMRFTLQGEFRSVAFVHSTEFHIFN